MNLIYFVSIPVSIVLWLVVAKAGAWQLMPALACLVCYLFVALLNEVFSEKLSEAEGITALLVRKALKGKYIALNYVLRFLTVIAAFSFVVGLLFFSYKIGIMPTFENSNGANNLSFGVVSSIAMLFFCVLGTRMSEAEERYSENSSWFRLLKYIFMVYLVAYGLTFIKGYITETASVINKLVNFCLFFNAAIVAFVFIGILWGLLIKLVDLFVSDMFTGFSKPIIVDLFACEQGIKKSIYACCEKRYGLDLSQSEVVAYICRIFEPTLIVAILFFWLSTCVVIVPIEQECVICRFGVVDGKKARGPGLHFKLPWPFADAVFFSPNKINVMNIGFEASAEKTDLIWSRQHSLTNDHLVVGDGVELINIDCQVFWKIKDLYKYFSTMQNPEEFIRANAYKLLTQATVTSTFDEIISRDRRVMTDKIKNGLQEFLDEKGLGIEITEVLFLAIHPPLDVASSFEDVISAKLDKLTSVLKAHTENEHKIHFHKADAYAVKLKAEMNAIETIQKAEGDAASIVSRAAAFNAEPELERYRLKLNLIQKIFSTKSIYVVDKTMMRPQDTIFLNMLSN